MRQDHIGYLRKILMFPQFRNWHFWMIQGLVILIASVHGIVETGGIFKEWEVPFVMPTGLFLVPVVYAALAFGLAAALITAVWAGLITIPNIIFWHQGIDRWGEIFQVLIVMVVAFFVGREVNRTKSARQQSEATAGELKASRIRYRGLFESSPIAILVLDSQGNILEANPAAATLFNQEKTALEGQPAGYLLGSEETRKILSAPSPGGWQRDPLKIKLTDGTELYLEPMTNELSDGQGNFVTEVLFKDVTQEHGRQTGMRAYTAYVTRAQEEERQRVARELHDQVIQSLVLLYRRLDRPTETVSSPPVTAEENNQEARKLAEKIIQELRDFTKALRPPALDDLGMVTSTRRLLSDFAERNGATTKFKVTGEERRLSSDAELSLFRIAQQALWNVEHHAKATRVALTITFTSHEIRLEVLDDGVGFSMASDPADLTSTGHLGLISMQERAKLLGGTLTIRSYPGKGSLVIASIPIGDN